MGTLSKICREACNYLWLDPPAQRLSELAWRSVWVSQGAQACSALCVLHRNQPESTMPLQNCKTHRHARSALARVQAGCAVRAMGEDSHEGGLSRGHTASHCKDQAWPEHWFSCS